jgi:hypothetical protein
MHAAAAPAQAACLAAVAASCCGCDSCCCWCGAVLGLLNLDQSNALCKAQQALQVGLVQLELCCQLLAGLGAVLECIWDA